MPCTQKYKLFSMLNKVNASRIVSPVGYTYQVCCVTVRALIQKLVWIELDWVFVGFPSFWLFFLGSRPEFLPCRPYSRIYRQRYTCT
jgi:hypothetical protein